MDVRALIAYAGRRIARPRYYANDHSRDDLDIVPTEMDIIDARRCTTGLEEIGFTLVAHRSLVADFFERTAVEAVYRAEILALITALTGADLVRIDSPGILRFSERLADSGALDNSRPARFAHVDVSDPTASAFARRTAPESQPIARCVHYNIWRALSPPPQDVPLALCDARSVQAADFIAADAIFDKPGEPEWSFEGLVLTHSAAHRWYWFADMTRDEAIVFKTHDSDSRRTHCVPHVAFDNPSCAARMPRVSIEMRALAYWFA